MNWTITRVLWLGLIPALVGCAPTRQARSVERSGFLPDYNKLVETDDDERPLQLYVARDYRCAEYRRVFVAPVALRTPDPTWFAAPRAAQEQLARRAHELLIAELGLAFEVVAPPAEHDARDAQTLHVRAALTAADRSFVGLDTLTTIHPMARLIGLARQLVADRTTFVGAVSTEVVVTGARDAPVLLAVDRRVGQKSLRGLPAEWSSASLQGVRLRSWADAHAGLERWARSIRRELEHSEASDDPAG